MQHIPVEAEAVSLSAAQRVRPYSVFALAVLASASLLNTVDRQILSILAESIKKDLTLNDAQLGFLLGTGFAVFYAMSGS